MKRLGLLAVLGLCLLPLSSHADLIGAGIVGGPGNHHLSWNTRLNYNYQIELSPTLLSWTNAAIVEPGTGERLTRRFSNTADRLFYRIHETADPNLGGFLALPTQEQELDLIDGVCFAFRLDLFPALPAKVRLYQRVHGSADPWQQIGKLTDFVEIDGIKTLRGSAVWIPTDEGEYDVRAEAVDGSDSIFASAERLVIIGNNTAPTVIIAGGPSSPSTTGQPAVFTTTVEDEQDEVRRVEFFDNGVLIGTDTVAPFGDEVRDFEGIDYDLLRGSHSITAKAYDSRGAVGETAAPFVVSITGGNARPQLAVVSPGNGLVVQQGMSFTVTYTVSDPDGTGDLDFVRAYDVVNSNLLASDSTSPYGPLVISTTGWPIGTYTIKIVASDGSAESYPSYLTIYVRSGSGGTFAETLVASIVDETKAAPSNESFTGVQASTSEFSDGIASGLQMDSGVIMTSGLVDLWNGGDISQEAWENLVPSFPNRVEPGDPQLEDRIAGVRTTDAAILEFDVYCENGQFELEYQFGSEEYDEYVGDFNDAFVVTVDGVVVSYLPDCSDIVSVNSVNQGNSGNLTLPSNQHLFLDDDFDIKPSVLPGDPSAQVEYDGMVVRLKMHAFIAAGASHRVRLVIADADAFDNDDDMLDSGLFLENSSLRTIVPNP